MLRSMNALLIYPRLNYPSRAAICPPLGILYIASALRSRGHRVTWLDLTHYEKMPDLEPWLRDADLAGISITSPMAQRAFEVVQRVRLIRPDIFCLAGGPHATVLPEQTLRAGFDAVVIGEGDRTILNITDRLEHQQPIDSVRGIALLRNDRVVMTEPEPFIDDLDRLPLPSRDLVDWAGYYSRSSPFDGVMASRGCPHRCLFCKPMQDRLFGKKIRYRSPRGLLEEIAAYRLIWTRHSPLASTGIPFLAMFIDDMFLSRPEWVYSFCDEAEKSGIPFWWGCQARVDAIREDLVKRMKDAGCRTIALGVESGSQKTLDFLRKDITVEKTRQAFDILHRLGVAAHAYILIGSPEESKEDLDATWELLRELRPTTCYVSRATPLPGSHLYEYALEHDILATRSFDENLDYYCNRAPMRLKYLTQGDLDEFEEKVCSLYPAMRELRK